jgi:predicted CXXCH cytochrome family protein
MQRASKRWSVVLLASGAAVFIAALVAVVQRDRRPPESGTAVTRTVAPDAYADASACAKCHAKIANTYALTGMARSFARLGNGRSWLGTEGRLHHKASDRHYTMLQRDGRFYERRHEIGFDGTETNTLEVEAHYVIGSGNHAQTFLHRNTDGRLFEMPVSWYSKQERRERGAGAGYWAMSPGYDKSVHQDFRQLIGQDCMSCHNGYPRALVTDDGNGPLFTGALPEGIDCQRCHGPGQAHIDAIQSEDADAGRQAIVNPGRFDRERQLEACMQCHLESTSGPLPFRIRRYEHRPFSYLPGKPLGDYFIHFDHAAGAGREDKFEIAGAAYRLRKSACFQRSDMTCLTCHDPHDIPRGAVAVQRYVAICQSCHAGSHRSGMPHSPDVRRSATCLDCHMPKRRTEDAVHVVMTDHYVQRRRPAADLLAPRREPESYEYRGDVALYYPPQLASTPENELYLALAQVQHGANLAGGIPRLERAIGQYRPPGPDFYYELARAYGRTSNFAASVRWCEEALARDGTFVPALKELGGAAVKLGRLDDAARALEKAVALGRSDGYALADLGNVYLQQGRVDQAEEALRRALTIDADLPQANNTLGLAALKRSDQAQAEKYFRAALRVQPDLAEAQNNLATLLAGRQAYREAAYHFEKAIRSAPAYVEARHSYGLVLALMQSYTRAVTELETAVRLAPDRAPVRVDLADVLATLGRLDEARREYAEAIRLDPANREARAGLAALRREGG